MYAASSEDSREFPTIPTQVFFCPFIDETSMKISALYRVAEITLIDRCSVGPFCP